MKTLDLGIQGFRAGDVVKEALEDAGHEVYAVYSRDGDDGEHLFANVADGEDLRTVLNVADQATAPPVREVTEAERLLRALRAELGDEAGDRLLASYEQEPKTTI